MNKQFLKTIRLAAGLLALACVASPLRGQYSWTGEAGDNDWFNAANWQLSGSAAYGTALIPNSGSAITYHWANARTKTLNVYGTGTVQVAQMHRYDPDSGFTLNIKSTSETETMTFNVAGTAFSRDSSISSSNWLALVNVGRNAIFTYAGTLGKESFIYLNLTDNAVFDVRPFTSTGATVTMRQMQAGENTTIYLGEKRLSTSTALTAGSGENVFAGAIITESTATHRGRIAKYGSGIVRITGATNFDRSQLPAGATIDNYYSYQENGHLIVESNLGHIRVGATNLTYNTTLAGTGTLGNVLMQYGILSAGEGANEARTGTLTILGNLDMTGGGNINSGDIYAAGGNPTALVADFGAKGAYDRITVSGTTTVKAPDSTFHVYIPAGELYAGDYTVLKSDGGIIFEGSAGFANTVLPDTLTIGFSGPYIDDAGTTLKLKLTQKYFGNIPGLTPGQQNVAKFLDDLWADGTPGDPTSYDPLVGIMNGKTGFKTLTAAMNQLSGQAWSHLYTAEVAAMNHLTEKIENHPAAPMPGATARNAIMYYFAPSYDEASVETTADTEKAKLKMQHYTAGMTHAYNKTWTLGLAADFGVGDYELDAQGSYSDTKTITGIASAGYSRKNFSAGALALYGWNSYDVKRSVAATRLAELVTAQFDGVHWGFDVWANYDIQFKWGSIKPYGKLYWMRWNADGFKETGSEAVRLDVGPQSEDTLQSRVGFRIEGTLTERNNRRGGVWHPFADVSWVQQWAGGGSRDIDIVIIGRPMTARTAEPDATGWRGSAGLSIDVTKRLAVALSASAQLGGMMDKQFGYNALIGWRF